MLKTLASPLTSMGGKAAPAEFLTNLVGYDATG